MHCVNPQEPQNMRQIRQAVLAAVVTALVGCSSAPKYEPTPAPAPAPQAQPRSSTPSPKAPAAVAPAPKSGGILAAPSTPQNWSEARHQAARRLVAANPEMTYMGKPPDLLLAIPVMTIELNADGSLQNISVMRYPSQARDTVDLAIAAIKRAAPFGDVSKLPKPWKFNETFLFNTERKFKPMTLDQK